MKCLRDATRGCGSAPARLDTARAQSAPLMRRIAMAARPAAVAGAKIVSVCDLQASSTLAATQHVSIGPPMRAFAPALAAHCRAFRNHAGVTMGGYVGSI